MTLSDLIASEGIARHRLHSSRVGFRQSTRHGTQLRVCAPSTMAPFDLSRHTASAIFTGPMIPGRFGSGKISGPYEHKSELGKRDTSLHMTLLKRFAPGRRPPSPTTAQSHLAELRPDTSHRTVYVPRPLPGSSQPDDIFEYQRRRGERFMRLRRAQAIEHKGIYQHANGCEVVGRERLELPTSSV